MQPLWAGGPMTSDVVHEQLFRDSKESTIGTVLRRLGHKGFVTHSVEGKTYVFEASERQQEVAARAVQWIVDWPLLDGSIEGSVVRYDRHERGRSGAAAGTRRQGRQGRAKQGRT